MSDPPCPRRLRRVVLAICAVSPRDPVFWSLLPSWLLACVSRLSPLFSQKVRWRNSSQNLGSHIRHCSIAPRHRNLVAPLWAWLRAVLFRAVLAAVVNAQTGVFCLLCATDISSHLLHADDGPRPLDLGHRPPKSKHRPPGRFSNQPDMSTKVKSSVQLDSYNNNISSRTSPRWSPPRVNICQDNHFQTININNSTKACIYQYYVITIYTCQLLLLLLNIYNSIQYTIT